jgi:phage tail tape-measure protein
MTSQRHLPPDQARGTHIAYDTPPRGRDPERNPDPLTGAAGSHPIGTGVGAGGGALAGAVIGTAVAGPVGTAIGGVVGAVVGGFAGKEIAEATNPTLGGAPDEHPVAKGTGATAGALAGAAAG